MCSRLCCKHDLETRFPALVGAYGTVDNVMQRGQDSFVYDSHHRLIEATVDGTTATYAYNVHHQRTSKTVGGTTTRFFYGPDGELLAEIDADSGTTLAEYVWLDGTPLAYLSDDAIYHIHVDHLGTPQVLTDDRIGPGPGLRLRRRRTPHLGNRGLRHPGLRVSKNHLSALKGHYLTVSPPADPLP